MVNNFYRTDRKSAIDTRNHIISKLDKKNYFYTKDINNLSHNTFTNMNVNEGKLDEYMHQFREKSREKELKRLALYPVSRPFYNINQEIEDSPLYKIFNKMPKGGLLHVHSAAALSFNQLLELLRKWVKEHEYTGDFNGSSPKSLFVVWNAPVKFRYADGTLFYKWFIEEHRNTDELCKYCTPLSEFLAEGEERLRQLLCFTPEVETISDPWDALNAMFSRTSNLLEDEEFYKEYHYKFFLECLADNIHYIEMRSGFQDFHTSNNNLSFRSVLAHPDYDWRRHFFFKEISTVAGIQSHLFLDCLQNIVQEINQTDKKNNLQLRVILNARRDLDPAKPDQCKKIVDKINSAILFHRGKGYERFHNFVIGFDFVSEEDRGQRTCAYYDFIYGEAVAEHDNLWHELFTKHELEKMMKVPRIKLIDFYLHDGESTWCGNENIIDACVVSQYRVGHGFNMINHPGLINGISFIDQADGCTVNCQACLPVLEICPISNQLLRYHRDLRTHPAGALMRQGVQCVICNDDPQMFNNGGLSYDFWMAYMAFGLDLPAIKRLVYNADYFAVLQSTNPQTNTSFAQQWDAFVCEAVEMIQSGILN